MFKQGKIVATPSQSRTSKAGRPFTIHSIVLEDGTTIEVGFDQRFEVGQQFSGMTEKKFGKLQIATEVTPTPGVHTPQPPPAPGQTATTDGYDPSVPTSKDKAIIRQNALTAASNIYAATLKAGSAVDANAVLGLANELSQFALGAWE